MKTTTSLVIACGVALAARMAWADDANTNSPAQSMQSPVTAQDFAWNASVANLKEIRLSEFAEQNSTNADVKLFARHMIHDHSMANRKLLRMASADSLNVPDTNAFYVVIDNTPEKPATQLMEHDTPENRLKEQQIAAQQLESFTGQTFDQSYADAMVKDHVDAIQLFQNASENVTNEDLKNFAAKTLPTLRHHYHMAQMLQNNVGPMSTNNVSNANGSTNSLPVAPGAGI